MILVYSFRHVYLKIPNKCCKKYQQSAIPAPYCKQPSRVLLGAILKQYSLSSGLSLDLDLLDF